MAWRSVMIQNPARLSLHRGQLRLDNDGGVHSLPLEDITALVLESPQVLLSSALLAQCQENGIAVVTCDQTHTPNGLMLPFLPHSRQSLVARQQISWPEGLKKRLWQRVVRTKIANQAACLHACAGGDSAGRLRAMARRVEPGDPGNLEAQAARAYWTRLMGDSFRRGKEDAVNAALNYGYAVLRACVARAQVAYGLLPAFGFHHDSELNAFNLTDDCIEVFRPFVDRLVFRMKQDGTLDPAQERLGSENRARLAAIASETCIIEGQSHNLGTAAEKMAAGLVQAIEHRKPSLMPVAALTEDLGEAGGEDES